MKLKQNPSNQEKPFFQPNKVSFKQTIHKIELSALKQQLQKKKITTIKNRLKQEWLDRIKIIPPRISPTDRQNLFRATDSFAEKDPDCFKHSKHLCYNKDLELDDIEQLFQKRTFQMNGSTDEITKRELDERKSYAGTSTGFQKCRMESLRQRKFKQSWKHSYRKDEMNVLRYSTSSPLQAKFYKTGEIGKMLYTMIHAQHGLTVDHEGARMIGYQKTPPYQQQEDKENFYQKQEEKKQDKKYRFNTKRNKTSLLLKKQLLQ